MIIDADGLFNGNRWRACSNLARLHAPYLLLASNGYGRLEVDPVRIIGRVYLTFNPRPTEDEIMALLEEYRIAHLLFMYEADGQTWGQWDTPERLLAKYLTASDKRSPSPPAKEFQKWKSEYRVENRLVTRNFPKVLETFKNSPCGVGVGVGEGVGVVKNICATPSGDARDGSLFPDEPKPKEKANELALQQDGWFEEFWQAYWLHKSRKASRAAFGKNVRTPARFDEVMAAVRRQSMEMLAREPSKRPHGSTWLNGERWMDEVSDGGPKGALATLYEELENNAVTKGN